MSIRFGTVLVCDNIYRDVDSNKIILAGVFSGTITVPQVPSLVRLSLYAEFFSKLSEEYSIDIQIFLGDKKHGGLKSRVSTFAQNSPSILSTPQFDLVVTKNITLIIKAIIDEGRPKVILKKSIAVAAPILEPIV